LKRTLPDVAVDFGASAEKAVVAAGGVDLARVAEADPARRATAAAILDSLGAPDLDPRLDLESAAAAGELARVAGRHALPYPVVAVLLADQVERPLALVAEGHRRVDHGDLFPAWRILSLDGCSRAARSEAARLGSKLGPFVTDLLPTDDACPADPLDSALHLTLSGWRVLGTVERALELAVDHVQGRHQFGQALAGFQAVQFQLADAAVAVDGLRELCRFTLWRIFSADRARAVDPLALRLHALDVARSVLRTTQQLFGAAGVCDEYDISVLVRHVQPELRLPFGSEQTAAALYEAVGRDGFAGLFPQGGTGGSGA
jgi:hypothetical protein